MICRKCNFSNPDPSVYCANCGAPLIRKPVETKKKFSWYLILASAVVVLLGIFLIKPLIRKSPQNEVQEKAEQKIESSLQNAPSKSQVRTMMVGDIIVQDFLENEITRSASVVMKGGWVAAPIGKLIGGSKTVFNGIESVQYSLDRGFWIEGDPVVLFKFPKSDSDVSGSFNLTPWKLSSPLDWHSLRNETIFRIDSLNPQRRGSYTYIPLSQNTNEPGVFIQNGRIVGWTFGGGIEKGYLWMGTEGSSLDPNINIDQFYFLILSDSRESQLIHAMALDENISSLEKLEAFAAAFHLQAKLALDDLPVYLKPEIVFKQMHTLASELIQSGSAEDVLLILDDQILLETMNTKLMQDAVYSHVEHGGYSRALLYLNNLKKKVLSSNSRIFSELDHFHGRLYKEWLNNIIEKKDFSSGLAVFEQAKQLFPDDLDIHLLGVEIAIAENDLEMAGDLLGAREYPQPFLARALDLKNFLMQQQEEQETIIIHFNPREKHIQVDAYVNEDHLMKFIIDTGASTSSIPPSAVDALGINITENTPKTTVGVAGGVGITYIIRLRSVEIEGYRVNNVKALIIDLPSYPNYGLLGLDFLNHFNMEIDNERGILKLRIR